MLYYLGDFAPYAELVRRNDGEHCKAPIYVGRAVREGARKGVSFIPTQKRAVYDRLRAHAGSVSAAKNLKLSDFRCRYLIVEDAFIDLAESVLISLFRPLWNPVVEGFGNNPTGGPRERQARGDWDVLHPGRIRGKGKGKRLRVEIIHRVDDHLARSSHDDTDAALARIAERVRKYTR